MWQGHQYAVVVYLINNKSIICQVTRTSVEESLVERKYDALKDGKFL